MKAYFSDHFDLALPAGHRFPMHKYRMLRDRITRQLPAVQLLEAPPATDGQLALVHLPEYVSAVAEGSLSPMAQREIGFPWNPALAERSRRSVGATVAAARSALEEGMGANLAGGTHHAYADHGSGFCVFNDVAVAARLMQAQWRGPFLSGLRRSLASPSAEGLRVAIVDLDVHQGNGTARIFSGDDTVFTLSIHGARNFPFRKEQGDLDVELPDGCDDQGYLAALDSALRQLDARFSPGLVLFLAGVDPFAGDRLGRLQLTPAGLAERDRRVFEWCWQRRIPVAFVMAGGYAVPVEDTVTLHCNTFGIAATYWSGWQNERSVNRTPPVAGTMKP
jgi:acetoin utilization deacetylase AcuC-like enzyme